jgi:hypothetical protein
VRPLLNASPLKRHYGCFRAGRGSLYDRRLTTPLANPVSEFHDHGDAKWIVIRGQLWDLNDTPFGRPTLFRPIGRPGVGCSQGVFGVFSYYSLVIIFFSIVPLIMDFTYSCHPGPYGKGCPRGKKTAAGRPPCGRATLQTAVRPFGGWPARRAYKGWAWRARMKL